MTIPITRRIAESGYTSRRKAEKLIRDGKVKVNKVIAQLGQRVSEGDVITIGNKTLKTDSEKVYIIINKPEGYVCSNRKFKGEKNIFDLLLDKKGKELKLKHRLFVVGRLDKNSNGLVLITNDGELTHKITHPRFQHEKEYEVIISNTKIKAAEVSQVKSKFSKGIHLGLEGGMAKAKNVEYLGEGKFIVTLTQGKKRQIRRMFEALDIKIKKLKRTRIRVGRETLDLGDLKKGHWRCLCEEEIARLKV